MRYLALLLAFPLATPPIASQNATRPAFRIQVRAVASSAFATVVVVETTHHYVVIDAGFSEQHVRDVMASTTPTGKPIAALLLTHAHIDHYGGAGYFRAAGVPVISGAGVARQIVEYDRINYARFGAAPPPTHRGLDRAFGDGDTLVVDGVVFTMHALGPGESYADVWWEIAAGEQRAAVIGDVAMYGIPPLMQSGHSADWMRSLGILKRTIAADTPIYIGHDARAAQGERVSWTHDILDWQIARIEAFRSVVTELTHRERLLTPEEIATVVARLGADAPENVEAFGFIISTSANILAAELMVERQKEEFERQIQALFAQTRE